MRVALGRGQTDRPEDQEGGGRRSLPKEPLAPITNVVRNAILGFRTNSPALPGDDIFKDLVIPRLEVEMSADAYRSLQQNPRRYIHATIKEGGKVYTNVAVHLKGGPGSFRNINDQGSPPAFTVNFEHFGGAEKFHGLKKIHLNNSVQDRTFLSEKISRELFEAAGVPAPRAGNVEVSLNGEQLGMFVLLEGVNKQFLKRYFKNTSGNIYDGHSGTDVTDDLPTNDGDDPKDKSRLKALARAARERNLDKRLAALEQTLDLDRFLTFVALEMILWHWDGYTIGRNNYRIFHDKDADKMVFFPHGLDQTLHSPRDTVFPNPANGLVTRAVWEIPEAQERYRQRLAALATNVFLPRNITNRIYEVAEKIESRMVENPRALFEHRDMVVKYCRRVEQRARSVRRQLFPSMVSESQDQPLTSAERWSAQLDEGDAVMDKVESEEGMLLHIATTDGCTASWRADLTLEPGSYRFEGRLRAKGVVLDPGNPQAAAGLRISHNVERQKNGGDRTWTPVAFDFVVRGRDRETQLVCELHAERGEIWFDPKAFKVSRR
jgi:hypothetical protein